MSDQTMIKYKHVFHYDVHMGKHCSIEKCSLANKGRVLDLVKNMRYTRIIHSDLS